MTNQNAKHTPGPWSLRLSDAAQYDGDRYVYARFGYVVCPMNGGPNDDSTVLANARLIAAAPELLDAAQELLKTLETRMMRTGASAKEESAFKAMRIAIAKAEGRV